MLVVLFDSNLMGYVASRAMCDFGFGKIMENGIACWCSVGSETLGGTKCRYRMHVPPLNRK